MDDETRAAIDRVLRKRAARVLVRNWLSFTPCPVADLETAHEPGDMPLTITVLVKKADIDKELAGKSVMELSDAEAERRDFIIREGERERNE